MAASAASGWNEVRQTQPTGPLHLLMMPKSKRCRDCSKKQQGSVGEAKLLSADSCKKG